MAIQKRKYKKLVTCCVCNKVVGKDFVIHNDKKAHPNCVDKRKAKDDEYKIALRKHFGL